MRNSRSRSAFLCVLATLVLVMLTTSPTATAAILIDDFDQPQMVTFPEGIRRNSVVEVPGTLPSSREIYPALGFNFRQQDLIRGGVQVGGEFPGVLVGRVSSYPALVGFEPSWANFNFDNYFYNATVDLSEGGLNDTIFLDIELLRAPGPVFEIGVELDTAEGSYASSYFGVASAELAFRLAFPASSFTVFRGGLSPNPNTIFKRVRSVG